MVKSDGITLFSYGSNMLAARLLGRAPSAVIFGTGFLKNHALRWHKVARDDSGKCDAAFTGDAADVVWGVLASISVADKIKLDMIEGLGAGYDQAVGDIETASGIIQAQFYTATAIDGVVTPYDWYKALVIAGAREHGLPADYIAALAAAPAKPDPDKIRAARNLAAL
jgi:gamma-glutamylcyclotransferase